MIQGEGGIVAQYSKKVNVTALDVRVAMTYPDPIFKLCDLFGVAGHRRHYQNNRTGNQFGSVLSEG
jgi:hypothetical protein